MKMCLAEETIQAYAADRLDACQREQVARHLASCDKCGRRAGEIAARHHRVDALLADLATCSGDEPVPVALARFRARVAAGHDPGFLARLGAAPRFWKTSAMAAGATVLAVALSGGWLVIRPGSRVTPARASREAAPSAVAARLPEPQPAPRPVVDAASQASPAATGRRSARRASPTDAYYLLIGDTAPPEVGMVVRVRMRVAALAPGVIAARSTDAEPEVEADVLVGEDGRARAIRFVNQTQTAGGR